MTSTVGYRRRGDDGVFYHPERDYAYITPELMCGAVSKLMADVANYPDEKAWCDEHGISIEAIAAASVRLALAQKDFINSQAPVASFEAALSRHGFDTVPFAVRQFLFYTFGYIFCAAWFRAVRDVSIVGQESPAQEGIATFAALARKFAGAAAADDDQLRELDIACERLELQNTVLQTKLDKLADTNVQLNRKLRGYEQAARKQPWFVRLYNRLCGGYKKCQSTGCTKPQPTSQKK